MKKNKLILFLKLLFVFFLVSMIIIYCEIHLRSISNRYIIKRKYFEQNLDSIQVLSLGSSEALYAINPEYFYIKGFNLAEAGQSLYYDKELVVKYIGKMPKLKFVLIPISYVSLWFDINNTLENYGDYYYYHFWKIKPRNPKLFSLSKFSFIVLYGINLTQELLKKNFEIPQNYFDDIKSSGWVMESSILTSSTSDESGENLIEMHNVWINEFKNMANENINILDSLLFVLANNNITPVFITIPVYYTYLIRTDPEKNRFIENAINNLCEKYHCKYFNYLYDKRFEVNNFNDAAHLNESGAEKFSKIINKEILSKLDNNNK